ncbi:MAG TPA: ABC transporter ATP-binding protein [Candidatus Limnocylindrales bacterium]
MTLRLSAATYRYAGARRDALDSVDLEISTGSVLGVVGPNEAGKSTLCLVASGLAPVVVSGRLSGSVTIDGRETTDMRPHELAQRCGILFQDAQAQLSGTASTVFEEVAFGPRNLGLSLPAVIERVEACLGALGIASLADRDPARLSGGQAQLVALAAILALRPDFLILDEPTSQLDPQGTRLVGDALRRLVRESRTAILVVEHKTALLDRLADRVVVVDEGRIVREGPTADVLGDAALPGHGVEPPPRVRVQSALAAAGLGTAAETDRLMAELAT